MDTFESEEEDLIIYVWCPGDVGDRVLNNCQFFVIPPCGQKNQPILPRTQKTNINTPCQK